MYEKKIDVQNIFYTYKNQRGRKQFICLSKLTFIMKES